MKVEDLMEEDGTSEGTRATAPAFKRPLVTYSRPAADIRGFNDGAVVSEVTAGYCRYYPTQ